jgi:hypothetical protein
VRILISKLVLLFSACVLTVVWLAFGPGPYDHNLAMMISKRELLAATPSPKLVLMGGSGLLNGIDSGLLARDFGIHVANVGVYAGCGTVFAADYIAPYLNEGDVLLLIAEYGQFKSGLALNDVSCRAWIARALFPRIPLSLYAHPRDLLLDVGALASSKVRGYLGSLAPRGRGVIAGDPASFRREFNEYGDKLASFHAASVLASRERLDFDIPTIDHAKEVLRDLARRVEDRKAQFRIVPPAVAASWYLEERKAIEHLTANLDPQTLLGHPEDYAYDDSLFQDTIYHLGPVGRRFRTERLSRAMRDEGLFFQRFGSAYSTTGTVWPTRYDLISGFHDDRTFTRGDARFYRLQYATKPGQQFIVVNTHGWVPYRHDLQRLGLRVFADGTELRFARQEDLSYWFELPLGAETIQEIRIMSNVFRPVDLGINDDGRLLGIDIANITFR